MGWLHDGHRSLIRQARSESGTTVITIFVNPRQFNEASDFTQYPRNEARDIEICEEEGADLIWAPPVEQVYPPGFDTIVSGHLDGVATVVAILFALVGAERAYFGQKDAQQLLVIRHMARDLALPTEVVGCPTVREPDGLALSSRNVHLTPKQRAAAPVLHQALLAGRRRWEEGEHSAVVLREAVRSAVDAEPLAALEYVSCADGETLVELQTASPPILLSLAARFGSTRLIDNELIE